jgi:hypothetical protein
MTETRRPATHAAPPLAREEERVPTGWVGWVIFAGVMMVLLGIFQLIAGLVAIFDRGFYLVGEAGLLVVADYTTWGWVHLGLGVLLVLAGFGVMAGQTWARAVGVVLAVLSAIVAIGFLAAFPILSAIIIVLDVIVIYALAVHGREAAYS